MTLATFATSSVGIEPARVVFSLFVNHTFREPKYYEILGLPTVQYKHFSYYSTNKSWSDDDLVISQNNFFRFLTLDDIEPTFIPSPDNSYCEDSRP